MPPMKSPGTRKSKSAGRKPSPARARGSGVQTVYDTLKRDILDMALAPGAALDEVGLSRRFRMSRTPVREALVRLAAEGLVTALPNRNTIVTPIDFTSVPVYFESLRLMYRATARLAAERRTDADLAAIRAAQQSFAGAVRAADAAAMIAFNRDFHLAIARAGRNGYFTDFFTRLLDEGRRLSRIYYASFDDRLPPRFVDEHEAILTAVAARDADGAERLAAEHAAQFVRQIQDFIASGLSADLDLSRLVQETTQ
jgi:DNA-binding GntR family transcriptional regulator